MEGFSATQSTLRAIPATLFAHNERYLETINSQKIHGRNRKGYYRLVFPTDSKWDLDVSTFVDAFVSSLRFLVGTDVF